MGAEETDPRAIAKLARAASRHVYAEWSEPHGDGNPGEVSQRAIEAQIAAAVSGRKPLYFEPWGKGLSEAFAASYRKVLPDAKVAAKFAKRRAMDFVQAFEWQDVGFDLEPLA